MKFQRTSVSNKMFPTLLFIVSIACMLLPVPQACAQTAPKITSLYVIDYASSISDPLAGPSGFYFDIESRELYVTDSGKKRIVIYDENGRFRTQIRLFEHYGSPQAMVVDGKGRIFLAPSYGHNMVVLDPNGKFLNTIDMAHGFDGPGEKLMALSMAMGPDGKIYLLTNLRGVIRIDPSTDEVTQVDLDVLDPAGKPRLAMVLDLAIDGAGNFLFGEMRPGSVVVFDKEGKYLRRFGESGGGPKQISRPTGITVDKEGRIYVLSTIRDMVIVYDREGNYLREWGGSGTTKGMLYSATKLAYDGRNRIYTLEPGLKRVQAFQIN